MKETTNAFFETFNQYFKKIYVLTIPSASKRQEEFSIDMAGLDYHFFSGISSQNLNIRELISKGIYDEVLASKIRRVGKGMSLAEIACAWGHRNIYEDMVANNISHALIFEDDCFPLKENMKCLSEMLEKLPKDWQIAYFDYNKNEKSIPFKRMLYHIQRCLGLLRMEHALIKNLFPKPVNAYWKKAGFHDYTNAYCVTLSGAQKLIELQTPFSMTSDNLLAHAIAKQHIVGYIGIPKLFSQKSVGENSSIVSLIERGYATSD